MGADTPDWRGLPTPVPTPEEIATIDLKNATIALRDAGAAMQRAQAQYREALEAFSRIVAPAP
jgi:hypothetical protein